MEPHVFMRKWLEAVTHGPLDALAELTAKDIVFRMPFAPPGGTQEVKGWDRTSEMLQYVWTAFPEFAWHDIVTRRVEGDPELYVTTTRSTARKSDGQPYGNTYVMLTRVRDGQVVEHTEYYNPLALLPRT